MSLRIDSIIERFETDTLLIFCYRTMMNMNQDKMKLK